MTSQALFQAFGPCSPEPLCLSLGVSIFLGCLYYTNHGPSPSLWNDRGEKFLFYCHKFLVCHHQQKGRFCWLALWKAHAFHSEWCYGSQLCFFTPQWLSQPLHAKPWYMVFHCQKAWRFKAAWALNGVLYQCFPTFFSSRPHF